MTIKVLTEHHLEFLSLMGGCTGSSESTSVKMPLCLKSHVTAQYYVFNIRNRFYVVLRGCQRAYIEVCYFSKIYVNVKRCYVHIFPNPCVCNLLPMVHVLHYLI